MRIAILTTKLCAISLLVLAGPALAQEPAPRALLDIDVTTSLDHKIGDGGFDYRTGSGRYFFPTLDKCGDRVSAVAVAWAKRHGLPLLKQETGAAHALLHFSVPRIKSIIEVSYIYSGFPENVRVSMYLKKPTGESLDAEIDDLKSMQIPAFKDALVEALKCG